VERNVLEGEAEKSQMVTTHFSYLVFGHGRHACPGHFFAATIMKVMMAHIVLNYDVKLENEGVRPANMCFAASCIPHQTAKVLFRKRMY
jgi:cytochrome P450